MLCVVSVLDADPRLMDREEGQGGPRALSGSCCDASMDGSIPQDEVG